ncbi:MAG: hypothetical protein WCG80_02555 [Spirochaetales bacterium]
MELNFAADYDFVGVVNELEAFHADVDQRAQRGDHEKDIYQPSRYLDTLRHLHVHQGCVLDYIPDLSDNGSPQLYVRPADSEALVSRSEFESSRRDGKFANMTDYMVYLDRAGAFPDWPSMIHPDDTPESYFELALLARVGGRCLLRWHAGYEAVKVFTLAEQVGRLGNDLERSEFEIQLPDDVLKAALSLDFMPKVNGLKSAVRVRFITFSNWAGFQRHTALIGGRSPFTLKESSEDLVPFSCGIVF